MDGPTEAAASSGADLLPRDGVMTPLAAETRQRIVEAASRLFHLYGFQKTTVADIARDLGMSPANVYRFFSSKTELVKAVTAEVTKGLITEMKAAVAAAGPSADERLKTAIRSHFEIMRCRYTSDRKIHDLLEAAMDQAWDEIETHKRDVRMLIAELIEDGIAAGEFPPQDVGSAALLFQHSLVMFLHPMLISQALRCVPDGHHEAMFEPMVEFALAALRNGRYSEVPTDLR